MIWLMPQHNIFLVLLLILMINESYNLHESDFLLSSDTPTSLWSWSSVPSLPYRVSLQCCFYGGCSPFVRPYANLKLKLYTKSALLFLRFPFICSPSIHWEELNIIVVFLYFPLSILRINTPSFSIFSPCIIKIRSEKGIRLVYIQILWLEKKAIYYRKIVIFWCSNWYIVGVYTVHFPQKCKVLYSQVSITHCCSGVVNPVVYVGWIRIRFFIQDSDSIQNLSLNQYYTFLLVDFFFIQYIYKKVKKNIF